MLPRRVTLGYQLIAGVENTIPSKSSRIEQREYTKGFYEKRHLAEHFFAKFKYDRAITMRYDQTANNFLGVIYLAPPSSGSIEDTS